MVANAILPILNTCRSGPADSIFLLQWRALQNGSHLECSTTEGLTAEDMTRAISAKYGAAIMPAVAAPASLANTNYSNSQGPIAQWEDLQYSVILSRTPFLNTFQLVICTKQLNDQAEADSAAAAKQAREDAPQLEIARVKKAADDLETARQNNLKSFRP